MEKSHFLRDTAAACVLIRRYFCECANAGNFSAVY